MYQQVFVYGRNMTLNFIVNDTHDVCCSNIKKKNNKV